jgi:hypothetical protein
MPQIVMLTHASHVNKQRLDQELGQARLDRSSQSDSASHAAPSNEPMFNGKRLEELNSEEYLAYMRS